MESYWFAFGTELGDMPRVFRVPSCQQVHLHPHVTTRGFPCQERVDGAPESCFHVDNRLVIQNRFRFCLVKRLRRRQQPYGIFRRPRFPFAPQYTM